MRKKQEAEAKRRKAEEMQRALGTSYISLYFLLPVELIRGCSE